MAMKYALLQHQGLTCFSWFLSKAICLSFAKIVQGELFLGVSVGNGVRGGLFLQAKGKWP